MLCLTQIIYETCNYLDCSRYFYLSIVAIIKVVIMPIIFHSSDTCANRVLTKFRFTPWCTRDEDRLVWCNRREHGNEEHMLALGSSTHTECLDAMVRFCHSLSDYEIILYQTAR